MSRSMVVSLIGRPNVGKSSLFNLLMGNSKKAITHDLPGVTRDRHYGVATFDQLAEELPSDLILVDTGGFYPEKVEVNSDATTQEKNHNKFFNIMTDHAQIAIEESDLVLFIVDVREGVMPFDQTIADYIRTQRKKFWLIINKYDSDKLAGTEAEFYSLGLSPDNMFVTSASHGLGVEKLRTNIQEASLYFYNNLKDEKGGLSEQLQKGVTPQEQVVGRLAILGAPNAGKSTLLNQLLGAQRALVSDIAGTTVDPIEGYFDLYFGKEVSLLDNKMERVQEDEILEKYNQFLTLESNWDNVDDLSYKSSEEPSNSELEGEIYKNVFEESPAAPEEIEELEKVEEQAPQGSLWRSIKIIDTAGVRRQKSVQGYIETQSVYSALRSVSDADIVVYMVDASQGINHQDRRLLDIAFEKGKSIIICLNKVDLLKERLKDVRERKEWIRDLQDAIPWLSFCDLISISAKYGRYLGNLKKAIKKTILVRKRDIPTGELNRFVNYLVDRHPIVVKKSRGSHLKVKYSSMIKSDPPTFLLFTNKSKNIPDHYKRYLKNSLRHQFNLYNTPIHLIFRTSADLDKRMKKITNS